MSETPTPTDVAGPSAVAETSTIERSDDEIIREQYNLYLNGIKEANTLEELEKAVTGLGIYFSDVLRNYPNNEEYSSLYTHLRGEYEVKKHELELELTHNT